MELSNKTKTSASKEKWEKLFKYIKRNDFDVLDLASCICFGLDTRYPFSNEFEDFIFIKNKKWIFNIKKDETYN